MSVVMPQDRLIHVVSLSTLCEPDVLDGKTYFKRALQILGALRDVSSETVSDTIEQLFCFRQTAQFLSLPPPDVFSIDFYSSYTFPFPDPLL
jgi:hypothetical protein